MEYGFNVVFTPGCCGIVQIRDFSEEEDDWDYLVEKSTAKAAYEAIFQMIRDPDFLGRADRVDYRAAAAQIWFYQPVDFEGKFTGPYVAEDLRVLIETIPNVVCLGEFLNPNSGNMIKGYQWELK